MSMSNLDEARKVNVLLIGERPRLFSFCRSPLEKAGCECHFAALHQEMGKLLSHTELDIVLSLNVHRSLSKIDSRGRRFTRKYVSQSAR